MLYVRADSLQIERKKVGRGFSYIDANGDRITEQSELNRLNALTVPPALTEVFYSHLPNGHLQYSAKYTSAAIVNFVVQINTITSYSSSIKVKIFIYQKI